MLDIEPSSGWNIKCSDLGNVIDRTLRCQDSRLVLDCHQTCDLSEATEIYGLMWMWWFLKYKTYITTCFQTVMKCTFTSTAIYKYCS